MAAKGDHYREPKQTTGESIDGAFGEGMDRDQSMEGSRAANSRNSRDDARGLRQPVASGTRARNRPPYKGDRV